MVTPSPAKKRVATTPTITLSPVSDARTAVPSVVKTFRLRPSPSPACPKNPPGGEGCSRAAGIDR
jgi:hypothetical protein